MLLNGPFLLLVSDRHFRLSLLPEKHRSIVIKLSIRNVPHDPIVKSNGRLPRRLTEHSETTEILNKYYDQLFSNLIVLNCNIYLTIYIGRCIMITTKDHCFTIHHCWAWSVCSWIFANGCTFANQSSSFIENQFILQLIPKVVDCGAYKKKMICFYFVFTKNSVKTIRTRTFKGLLWFRIETFDYDF